MALQYLCFGRSKKHSSSSKRPYPTVIEELCTRFSLANIRKATNNFDKNNVIGRGRFGKVYKGCLTLDGHVATTAVAVKRMGKSTPHSTQHSVAAFRKEVELLCQLRRPNLISLIGFCIHKDERIIVYEYMSNGSLADHLFKRDGDRELLSWKKRLEICIGAARGLHYLQSGLKRTIIHRDIKPSNILLDDNMIPKLSGFGISVQGALFTDKPKPIQVKEEEFIATLNNGTLDYMPPEYFSSGPVTDQYDVYSFGVVLFQVVSAEPIETIMQEITHKIIGKLPQQQPDEEIEMSNTGSESSDYHFTMPSYIMKETGEYQQQPDEEIEMSNNSSESSDYHFTMPSYITKETGEYQNEQPDEEIEMSNEGSESPDHSFWLHSYVISKLRVEDIDPALAGNIAPECYAVYINVIESCLKVEPNERPTMGEVEVLLEHALKLQQEADTTEASDDYL